MSTIFGDFVFKITAPVENALKNLKQWDKQQNETVKNSKKATAEETDMIDDRSKKWKSFLGGARLWFAGFAATVMKWSPHIRAHLSIMGLHMRLLAMDVCRTWAPAFKVASKAMGELSKWWRSLGKE